MNIPSKEDLDNLFGPMFEEYFEKTSFDTTINSVAQPTQVQEDSSSTSSIFVDAHEAPPIVTTSDEQTSPISLTEADEFNQEDTAEFNDDVWEKCQQNYKKPNEAWHDEGYEEDEMWRSGDEKTDYDPLGIKSLRKDEDNLKDFRQILNLKEMLREFLGPFTRECRAPRENRNIEPIRKNMTVETTDSKALVAQDILRYNWSDQAKEGPTNFALIAYTSSCSSSSLSSDSELRKKFEKAEKKRDDLKLTLEKSKNSSKNLSKLLDSQVCDKFKTGVGFDSQVVDSQVFDSQENDRYKTSKGYHVVPPPYTGNFMPPKSDLVFADKDEYVFSELVTSIPDVATSEANTSESKPKSVGEPLIKEWISDRFEFETTNNEAKYEALLAGLRIDADIKIKDFSIFVDSQLVSNQVKSLFKAIPRVIKQYLKKTKEVLGSFKSYTMEHVRRDQNKKDNALSKLASMTFSRLAKEVLVEVLAEKLIVQKEMSLNNDLHNSKKAKARHDIHNFSVTFFSMGNQYHKTFANGSWRCKFLGGSYRLFYEMGRSEAPSIHNRKAYGEVHMGAYRKGYKQRHRQSRRSHRIVETKKVKEFKARKNDKMRREELDILEEWREITSMRESHHKQKMERCYNKRVRSSTFKPGTYALRLNSASKAEFQGNMGPT
ncbi:retrovirus-related pol polyprotein from transposon TNT 1-94 [Tanacetum coccineum]